MVLIVVLERCVNGGVSGWGSCQCVSVLCALRQEPRGPECHHFLGELEFTMKKASFGRFIVNILSGRGSVAIALSPVTLSYILII
jgi:hypothetical protein